MKILFLTLSVLCVSLSACTKDEPAKPTAAGTVGKGLGGQTVGTSFAGSSGANSSVSRGTNVGQGVPGQQ